MRWAGQAPADSRRRFHFIRASWGRPLGVTFALSPGLGVGSWQGSRLEALALPEGPFPPLLEYESFFIWNLSLQPHG